MNEPTTLITGVVRMLLAQVIAALLEGQFELHKIDANQMDQPFDGATFSRASRRR